MIIRRYIGEIKKKKRQNGNASFFVLFSRDKRDQISYNESVSKKRRKKDISKNYHTFKHWADKENQIKKQDTVYSEQINAFCVPDEYFALCAEEKNVST